MLFFNSQKRKIQKVLRNIEKGRITQPDLIFIKEANSKEPSILPEMMGLITSILDKGNTGSFSSAIRALNAVADNDIGAASKSFGVVAACLRKDLKKEEMIITLDIIYKISKNYPDLMGTAVPELINCLQNIDSSVREKAYFLLAPLADGHPEFYENRSKDLIRALNGLNVDARIYACRLIGKIAEKNPAVVKDTYDDLKYMYLNHLSREMRLEALDAMHKLKIDEKVILYISHKMGGKFRESGSQSSTEHQLPSAESAFTYVADDKEMQALDSLKSDFIELLKPKGEDVRNMLTSLGLEHMIVENAGGESRPPPAIAVKKEPAVSDEDKKLLEMALEKTLSNKTINSAMVLDSGGNTIALSGPPIDRTLIGSLKEMLSFEINDKFRSRVSFERANNKIVAVRLGMNAILVIMTDANIPIGAVILELNKSIEKIDKLGSFSCKDITTGVDKTS